MALDNIYQQLVLVLLRKALTALGAILVARGWADEALVSEVAAGVALLLVSTLWSLWALHRRRLYAQLLLRLGLAAPPDTDPATIVASAKRALTLRAEGAHLDAAPRQ